MPTFFVCCLGTLFGKSFRPPESYSNTAYDPTKVDVFCLGWMLFFSVTKHQVFDTALAQDPKWVTWSQHAKTTVWHQHNASHLSDPLKHLLWLMLNPSPAARPSLKQCFNHIWFQGKLETKAAPPKRCTA